MSRITSTRNASGGAAGNLIGANEDMFLKAFDQTPKLEIATQKKLENELARVVTIISNPNADWDNRVQAIKHFRTLVNSGIDGTENFHSITLKSLEIPFQNNLCDLRSQVVRETCITIAFLSCRMQHKFARMSEILLPSLIKLIPNSAKIVSTSALVALRFIIQSTQHSKLIPIFKYQLSNSKSKDIHKALCEIMERIVTLWPPHVIERQLQDFTESLRLGICNSDESARQYARRAFNVFAEHFREPADRLYNSLDAQRQRMLNNLSHGGGSTLSINDYGSSNIVSRPHGLNNPQHHNQPSSLLPSVHHHHHYQSSNHSNIAQNGNSGTIHGSNFMPRLKSSLNQTNGTNGGVGTNLGIYNSQLVSASPSRIRTPTARSTSAIDVAAQKRARARAVYLSSMQTQARQIGQSYQTPNKSILPHSTTQYHYQTPSSSSQHQMSTIVQTPTTNHHNDTATPTTPHHLNDQTNYHTPCAKFNSSHQSQMSATNITPSVAQQQKELQEIQKEQAESAEKKDGGALSKAASYLASLIGNSSMAESQIVSTLKYFNSLIETHPSEVINQHLAEIMAPLVVGIGNSAICVRKASVFAMVAVHAKVGLQQMENYLAGLATTQRKLLEVYIDKSRKDASQG